jgi:hypothetical protein
MSLDMTASVLEKRKPVFQRFTTGAVSTRT